MKSTLALLVLVHGWAFAAFAAAPAAEQVLGQAQAKAAAEHKAIYVHFGASWCGWCKRLDAFLERPEIKPVFEKYFIPLKLVVNESADKKSLENAGADKLLVKFGGPEGLPYSAFLDSHGSMIVNSRLRGKENIGYPADPQDIDWFMEMIRKAAPQITAGDAKTIEGVLRSFKK